MSYKYDNLDYENDNHESVDQEEPMEVADLSEVPTEDPLGFLMCGEREIFSQDSLMNS